MVSRIVSAIVLLIPLTVCAELDLTPLTSASELEGRRMDVTAFRNGSELVTWQAPHQWRLSGTPRRLSLIPPNTGQADAIVETRERPPVGLDANYGRFLKDEVARSLPSEASKLEWAEDELNPLQINLNPVYKITGSYSVAGQRFSKAIWVCNFADQQVRFYLTARVQDFPKLHEIFRESLYTWQGLK